MYSIGINGIDVDNPFLYGKQLSGNAVILFKVITDSPAWEAGLRKGDIIVKIDKIDNPNIKLIAEYVKNSDGNIINFHFYRLRHKNIFTAKITPKLTLEHFDKQ